MKIILLSFFLAVGFLGSSQDVISGFYHINTDEKGIVLKGLQHEESHYVKPEPILVLSDVEKIYSEKIGNDVTYSLTLSLTDSGKSKMIRYSSTFPNTKVALVLDDTIVKTATMSNPIANMFSINGFDKKEVKALRKRLKTAKENITGIHYLYVSDDFAITKDRANYGATQLYSVKADKDAFMKRESSPDAKCPPEYKGYYNPLSSVGSYYSYEFGNTATSSCVRLGRSVGVKTIDVSTGEEVSLLRLFDEQDIVNAFKKDAWVQQMAKAAQIELTTIHSFQAVLDFNSDRSTMKFRPSAFCIVGYEKGIAKIKFIGRGYVGGNSYRHATIAMELPVKQNVLELFKQESNFYLGRFENGLH